MNDECTCKDKFFNGCYCGKENKWKSFGREALKYFFSIIAICFWLFVASVSGCDLTWLEK